jgi:hypothetical protein
MKKIIISLLFLAISSKAESLNFSSASSSLSSSLLMGEDLSASFLTCKKTKLEKKEESKSMKSLESSLDDEGFSDDESLAIFLNSFASLKGIKNDGMKSKSSIEKAEKKLKKIMLVFEELKGRRESISTIKNLVNSDFNQSDIVLAIKELREIIPKMIDSTSFPKFIKSFIINSIENSSPEELSKNRIIQKFVIFLRDGKEEAIQRLESIKETVLDSENSLGNFDLVERILNGFSKQDSPLEVSRLDDVVLS